MFWLWVILVFCILYIIIMFNTLVSARNRTKEAWSGIETQLKRRYDLIPNLIETVKGYAQHEQATLEKVITARNSAMNSSSSRDPEKMTETEMALSSSLKTVFALSENYPDLKANQNFLELQRELADTETKIQASRQFYNTCALDLNNEIDSFPSNILAKMFKFTHVNYFELEAGERKAANTAPKVSF